MKLLMTVVLMTMGFAHAQSEQITVQAIEKGINTYTISLTSPEDLSNLRILTSAKTIRFVKQDSSTEEASVYLLDGDMTFQGTHIYPLRSDDFEEEYPRIIASQNTDGKIQVKMYQDSASQTQPIEGVPQIQSNPATQGDLSNQGGYHPEAQAIAQRRANEMARNGIMSHAGGGSFQTSLGRLFEGIGMATGGLMPNTCQGSGDPVADAHAYGRDGRVYRVRLYTTPTRSPNGGGFIGNRSRVFSRRR